jgi:hypothetical protein
MVTPVPHVFQATIGFRVPDMTWVFPLLNSSDVKSGLPPGVLDAFSLAVGEIEPNSSSKIHVHPLVTQVTLVLDGRLEIRCRDDATPEPHTIQLAQHQAALMRPGAFLQLINRSLSTCRVLYIVGPAYVFEVDAEGRPVYEDAITLEESWEELAELGWTPARLSDADVTWERRDAALGRIRQRAGR